ncbi:MAG: hypothetical protein ACYDCO_22995 [Armatimonadota bacterium]
MLFTTLLEKNIRRVYLADASSVVLWSPFVSNVLAFVFVLACRAGAGPEMIAICTSLMYVPSTLAFVMPMLSRRMPLGAMVILLRMLAGAGMLYCALVPTLTGLAVAFTVAMLAYGFAEIAYPALFNALYPAEYQTRVLGLIQTERSALVFVSLLALGPMLKALDSTGGIRLLGGLGVLGILVTLLPVRERPAAVPLPAAAENA